MEGKNRLQMRQVPSFVILWTAAERFQRQYAVRRPDFPEHTSVSDREQLSAQYLQSVRYSADQRSRVREEIHLFHVLLFSGVPVCRFHVHGFEYRAIFWTVSDDSGA